MRRKKKSKNMILLDDGFDKLLTELIEQWRSLGLSEQEIDEQIKRCVAKYIYTLDNIDRLMQEYEENPLKFEKDFDEINPQLQPYTQPGQ